MLEEYYVEIVGSLDVQEQGKNIYGCLPRMRFPVPLGSWLIKSSGTYRDFKGETAEWDSWHPELGIFETQEDANKRLNDLKISKAMENIVGIIRPEDKKFGRRTAV